MNAVNPRQSFVVKLIHCGNRNIANADDRGEKYIFYMSMGIFSLADHLKKSGFDVEILHLDLETAAGIETVLDFHRLEAVGFACHWANQAMAVLDTARLIKKIKPGVFIFLGGYTASFFAREILSSYPEIDAVIRGDAEIPLAELCRALREKESGQAPGNPAAASLEQVPNLAWRGPGQQVVLNRLSYISSSEELSRFDFARMDLLKNWRYYRDISKNWTAFSPLNRHPLFFLEIGRGCQYNCAICGGNANAQERINQRKGLAVRTVDAVIATIKKAVQYGYSCFFACFEFARSQEWYLRLFHRIREEKLQISFVYECWGIPSTSLIDALSATFEHVMITISPDSGDEKVRQKNKDSRLFYSNSQLEACLDYLGTRTNIKVQLYFGYFLPSDTRETVFKTMDYITGLFPKYNGFTEFVYMNVNTDPGSLLFLDPGAFDFDVRVRRFSDYLEWLEENYLGTPGGSQPLTLLSKPRALPEPEAVNLANKINLFNHLLYFSASISRLHRSVQDSFPVTAYLGEIDLTYAREEDFPVARIKALLLNLGSRYLPGDRQFIDLVNDEYEKMTRSISSQAKTGGFFRSREPQTTELSEQEKSHLLQGIEKDIENLEIEAIDLELPDL